MEIKNFFFFFFFNEGKNWCWEITQVVAGEPGGELRSLGSESVLLWLVAEISGQAVLTIYKLIFLPDSEAKLCKNLDSGKEVQLENIPNEKWT